MQVETKLGEHTNTSSANGGPHEQRQVLMKQEDFDKWRASVKHIQDCHYDTAASLSWHHYATGVPLVILSAVSASSIVSDAETLAVFGSYSKLIASVLGLLVTVLAAIQAFLGFEKRSGLHYKVGAKYGAIKREMDLNKELSDGKWLLGVNERWNALTEESPIIPLRIWRRNEKRRHQPDQRSTSLARTSCAVSPAPGHVDPSARSASLPPGLEAAAASRNGS